MNRRSTTSMSCDENASEEEVRVRHGVWAPTGPVPVHLTCNHSGSGRAVWRATFPKLLHSYYIWSDFKSLLFLKTFVTILFFQGWWRSGGNSFVMCSWTLRRRRTHDILPFSLVLIYSSFLFSDNKPLLPSFLSRTFLFSCFTTPLCSPFHFVWQ